VRLPKGWSERTRIKRGHVLVEKCIGGTRRTDGMVEAGGIVLPDRWWKGDMPVLGAAEMTNWMELVMVGDGCKVFKEGMARRDRVCGATVWCPDMSQDLHWVEGDYWITDEKVLVPAVFGDAGEIILLGRNVLVELDGRFDDSVIKCSQRVREWLDRGIVVLRADGVCKDVQVRRRVLLEPEGYKVFRRNGKLVALVDERNLMAVKEDSNGKSRKI
jgi:hypothetical protein